MCRTCHRMAHSVRCLLDFSIVAQLEMEPTYFTIISRNTQNVSHIHSIQQYTYSFQAAFI